jgi:patatin-like phospholipase/acyl hydrolase
VPNPVVTTSGHNQHEVATHAVLSFDGGGVRGLSQLIILEMIMNRISELEFEEERARVDREGGDIASVVRRTAHPREYFELICGTSTGGLNAMSKCLLFAPRIVVDGYL